LSKHADIAMYQSKKEGKGRVTFFHPSLVENSLHHIEMAKKMQKAIEQKSFELYYQPLYQLSTKTISGMEALIRWNDPTLGFIPPSVFIPLAEETGQIYEIEQWVFRSALKQRNIWDDAGYENLNLSINLSGKTLMSDSHFASIEEELNRYGGNRSQIMIEITETAVIHDVDLVVSHLERLRFLKTKIALDDFGTGYSSLTHIKTLPIDVIKLDRDFIGQIENKGKDETIVRAVINLVKKLGYKLVAEGIETESQYQYLDTHGCEFGQGYLMSRPLPVKDINRLLESEKNKTGK
jgi:EAL domain-containing protein (putative c-di-GMP-specific phosphodiesterase class I)